MSNTQTLKDKRVKLEESYSRKELAHAKKFHGHIAHESAYHDSCRELNELYDTLADVCRELGDPIPIRM